ncbi:MAG: hypothetical protein HY721_03165 [Planctomycetes bacterium]|nr:hypothetical protein [Planctomycetota bacterium]
MRRVLVFRHGIVINRYFLLPMERYFRARGWDVRNRSYSTTRKLIEEHARDLSEELLETARGLEREGEPCELYALTHSMGGLVLRYALTHFQMPPIRRAVMLVPPNQGSATARFFQRLFLYRWVFGAKAGGQLAAEPPGIFAEAGVPEGVEIGIIAGDVPWKLYPSGLERPHDGVVAVSEARLPPFPLKVLPYGHTPILWVRSAWEEAERFLEQGTFLEAEARSRAAT